MTSPFSTFEEFSSAKGPIYTFANNSLMISFLLILCVLILLYFIYSSYFMKQEPAKTPDIKAIGLLLVAGFASIMGTLFDPSSERRESVRPRYAEARSDRQSWQPLALFGMVGLGGTRLGVKLGTKSGKNSKRRSPRKWHHLR